MKRPSPGEYRTPIEIQKLTTTKDAEGGMVKTWVKFKTARAKKNNLSGGEQSATKAGGTIAVSRTVFWMHYQPGITEEMRIVCDGKYYNINHVNNYMEQSRDLIITCTTGANLG